MPTAKDVKAAKGKILVCHGADDGFIKKETIDGFRNGKYDILVATDVAARGIDVADISHVINFDMPDTVDAYTHRIGRTGRAEESGEAFTLAVPEDASQVRAIEKAVGKPIERRRMPGFNYGDFRPESQFLANGTGQKGRSNGKKNHQYHGSRRYRPQKAN